MSLLLNNNKLFCLIINIMLSIKLTYTLIKSKLLIN